jgi:hypothetical protein
MGSFIHSVTLASLATLTLALPRPIPQDDGSVTVIGGGSIPIGQAGQPGPIGGGTCNVDLSLPQFAWANSGAAFALDQYITANGSGKRAAFITSPTLAKRKYYSQSRQGTRYSSIQIESLSPKLSKSRRYCQLQNNIKYL